MSDRKTRRNTLPTVTSGGGVLGPLNAAANSAASGPNGTIASNLEPTVQRPTEAAPERRPQAVAPAPSATKRRADRPAPRKVKFPFNLSTEVLEDARNAVMALLGTKHRTNLSRLAEEALRREIARLEKLANDGRPFPAREGELEPGRPLAMGQGR